MYFSIREITIVRLLVPFIIGVVIGDNIQYYDHTFRIFLAGIVFYVGSSYLNPKVRLIVQNLLIYLLFLLAGLFTMHTRGQLPEISASQLGRPVYSTIVLRDFPKTRNSHIIRGEVLAIDKTSIDAPIPVSYTHLTLPTKRIV